MHSAWIDAFMVVCGLVGVAFIAIGIADMIRRWGSG
jgi:hypothetical protein